MVASLSTSLTSWGAAVQTFGTPLVLQDVPNKCQHRRQGSSSAGQIGRGHRCPAATAAVVCSLFVVASARCKPRTSSTVTRSLRFETSIARSKCRRRRGRRGSGSGADDDIWDSSNWDDVFGTADGGDGGSSGGWNGGRGSAWGPGGHSGDAFHKALFECMWVWQLLCAVTMLQSWYFMLFPNHAAGRFEASSTSGDILPATGVVY